MATRIIPGFVPPVGAVAQPHRGSVCFEIPGPVWHVPRTA